MRKLMDTEVAVSLKQTSMQTTPRTTNHAQLAIGRVRLGLKSLVGPKAVLLVSVQYQFSPK